MEKFQGYLEKYEFHQQQCLYPLLFQEYLYAFAYDYGFNVSLFYESVENWIGYNNKYSLILVKHLIHRIYQQNDLIHSWNHSKLNSLIEDNIFFYSHFDSQMISEGFGLVIDISFLLRLLSSSKKKEILKLQNLRSIHSTFSFLEDKFSHFNYVSDILIPYPIHFKILVPILQYWIKDVPFLHLLQFFILQYSNRKTLINSKKGVSIFLRENKRFFRFIYNSYVSEYEFVFYFLHQKSSFLKFTFFGIFLERIYFYGKIENFKKVYLTSLQEILCFFTDSFIHYIRYQNKAIFSSRGTLLFMKKSKSYLVYFWQYYFHFWFQPNRILFHKFSQFFFYFLGYHISVKKNHLIVRVKILDNLVLIDTLHNKLDTLVPVIPLIRSLSKAKFCTTSGHPLSKPIWADLSDRDILNRFGQICRKILHYYSGSLKKRSLYRIKYILRLSCARTLARKHKIPVRTFMQKLGTTLLKEFFTEEKKVFSLVFQKTIHFSLHKFNREPVWYLNIICINDFLDFS